MWCDGQQCQQTADASLYQDADGNGPMFAFAGFDKVGASCLAPTIGACQSAVKVETRTGTTSAPSSDGAKEASVPALRLRLEGFEPPICAARTRTSTRTRTTSHANPALRPSTFALRPSPFDLRDGRVAFPTVSGNEWRVSEPSLLLLIPAYNEEQRIGRCCGIRRFISRPLPRRVPARRRPQRLPRQHARGGAARAPPSFLRHRRSNSPAPSARAAR